MIDWLKWPKRKETAGQEVASDRAIVHFTDAALAKMLEVLENKGGRSQQWVRITAEEGPSGSVNYGMTLEESSASGDTVIETNGVTVLVDPRSLHHVNRCTVDYLNDPLQPGFKIEPPAPEYDAAAHAHAAVVATSRPQLDLSNPVIRTVQSVIDEQVNPGIASHGGRATLIDVKDQ